MKLGFEGSATGGEEKVKSEGQAHTKGSKAGTIEVYSRTVQKDKLRSCPWYKRSYLLLQQGIGSS